MSSTKIINLEQTQELQELNIVTKLTFNPEKRKLELKLNSKYNDIPLFTFPISLDQFHKLQKEDIENIDCELHTQEIEANDIEKILEVFDLEINKNLIVESIKEYYIQNLNESKTNQSDHDNIDKNKKNIETQKNNGSTLISGSLRSLRSPEDIISEGAEAEEICIQFF